MEEKNINIITCAMRIRKLDKSIHDTSLDVSVSFDVSLIIPLSLIMDFNLVQDRKENCHHNHIPFNVKENGNMVSSMYDGNLLGGINL